MKLTNFYTFISVFATAYSFILPVNSRNTSNLCDALRVSILRVNFQGALTANFISVENSTSFITKDFIQEFLMEASEKNFTYRHENPHGLKNLSNHRKSLSIFVVENFQEFRKIYKNISREVFKFYRFFFIVLVNGEIPEIQKIFESLWTIQIFNVNLMFEDQNGEVLVKTFAPFTPESCNDTSPVQSNSFKNGKFIKNSIFLKKLRNLHNCPIRVAVANNSEPYVIERLTPNGTRLMSGREISLITTLAETLNFKIVYSYIGDEGYFYPNKTSIGVLKSIADNKTDLALSNLWLKMNRMKSFGASFSYSSDQIVFVIPLGKKFTALQTLIYPFKRTFWGLILLFYFIGVLVIFFVKRKSKTVQNFIFGSGVRNPFMNMFTAFLGGNQKKLPKRNFARYLLMMFLIYSLVIRTLYQGSFFKLLTSNKRNKEVQTINEMIEKDFKFYVYEGNEDIYHAFKEVEER